MSHLTGPTITRSIRDRVIVPSDDLDSESFFWAARRAFLMDDMLADLVSIGVTRDLTNKLCGYIRN